MTNSIKIVKAKVIETRFHGEQKEPRNGTKHFRANAKVFVIDAYWGACDSVTVVGHHRSSGRYAKLDMPVKQLDDFEMEVVYSPKVIELLEEHFNGREPYTEDYGNKILKILPEWKEMWS